MGEVPRARLEIIGGALAVALAVGTAVQTQPFNYDRLVRAYAAGQLGEAVSELSRWPREPIRHGVDATVKAVEPRLRAAIMLHTDVAASSLGSDVALAEFHMNSALTGTNSHPASFWSSGSWTGQPGSSRRDSTGRRTTRRCTCTKGSSS